MREFGHTSSPLREAPSLRITCRMPSLTNEFPFSFRCILFSKPVCMVYGVSFRRCSGHTGVQAKNVLERMWMTSRGVERVQMWVVGKGRKHGRLAGKVSGRKLCFMALPSVRWLAVCTW